jgi:hypothetical protein
MVAANLVSRQGARVDLALASAPAESRRTAGPRVISAPQFRWLARHGHYDAVLYLLGAGEEYLHVLTSLRQHPGVVWLQDTALAPLYREAALTEGLDPDVMPRELRRWTRRYPTPDGDVLVRDPDTQRHDSIALLGEAADCATAVIAGSEAEREVALIESGGRVAVTLVPRETWATAAGIDAVCEVLAQSSVAPRPVPLPAGCCRDEEEEQAG